ncbi:GTPase [Sphaerisporangium corydalis]|uniref:GTPase n=1 Tax=Sphaerisporangium corydalis TaxID=1441875 RepID=A0ABV9ESR3_9ACTN|nr:GTPase [Sphaerisporangium corydalis]
MKLLRRPGAVSLDDRLAALGEAAGLAEGRLDAEAVARARDVVSRAGARRSLSVEHTVVALAGATGSGKSSLFNALSGTSLAGVGVTRPTTSTAQAAMWDPEGAGPLLDWLRVPHRHAVGGPDELSGLILLDLPDHDSIELAHRLEVDRLVAVVDLLVWVLDPQKYADAAVHERYLRSLGRHRDVMLVVLNQTDRLAPAAAERCVGDLRRLLDEDGLSGVPVIGTSVTKGTGIADLRATLAKRVADRRTWATRLTADAGTAADALALASAGGRDADGGPASVRDPEPGGRNATGTGLRDVDGTGARDAGGTGPWNAGGTGARDAGGVRRERGGEVPGSVEELEKRAGAAEAALDDVLARPLTAALAEAAGVPLVVAAVAKAHRHRSVAATGWPVTRWLRRFRPDPLRRLHLAGPSAGRGAETGHAGEGRTSLPPATAVQRSRMETAIRDVGTAVSGGLPEPWAAAVRRAARSMADDLADGLDKAVSATAVGARRRPRWWRVAGLLQWLLFAVMVAGIGWLSGLFALTYLRFPEPPTPTVGTVPWPTALLAGGAAAGVLVALLCRIAAALGARRRARKARKALYASVDAVGRELVLDPVRDELSRTRRFGTALTTARR